MLNNCLSSSTQILPSCLKYIFYMWIFSVKHLLIKELINLSKIDYIEKNSDSVHTVSYKIKKTF